MNKAKTIEDLLSALTEDMSAGELLSAAISSNISNAIARRRITMGLNQRELAEKIGMSQSTISKWENGDLNFTIDTLADIAVKLGMDLVVELKSTPQVFEKNGYRIVSGGKVITIQCWQNAHSFTGPNEFEAKEM